jgi:hypothetical protein
LRQQNSKAKHVYSEGAKERKREREKEKKREQMRDESDRIKSPVCF